MCRKLLFLIALLGLVSTAWADDLNPPPWRGDPGSTVSQYNYDSFPASGNSEWPLQAPEYSNYVSHPEKGDPGNFLDRAIDEGWAWQGAWSAANWDPWNGIPKGPQYYEDNFSMQVWAAGPTWVPTYAGRTGVLQNFAGSYDIYNFWSMQPLKDIWLQVTWKPQARTGADVIWEFELEPFILAPLEWIPAWWEPPGPVEMWDVPPSELVEIWEVWWQAHGWNEWDEWYEGNEWLAGGMGGWEPGFWDGAFWQGGDEPVYSDEGEIMGQLEPFEEIDVGDGWTLSKFLFEVVGGNPVLEFLGMFPEDVGTGEGVSVDQVVIDTICYVPEPATIALLGLGGLALIRRKKR